MATKIPPRKPVKKEVEVIKKKQQEEDAAKAFDEFVSVFADGSKSGPKAFIKGTTINPETKEEHEADDKGRVYKPSTRYSVPTSSKSAPSYHKEKQQLEKGNAGPKPQKPKRDSDKKKSNLESFKEELKRIQEEREERHRLKELLKEEQERPKHGSGRKTRFEPAIPPAILASSASLLEEEYTTRNSYDSDPNTTNLYMANLNPKLTEQDLCQIFGKYGPLASVKIMWPRTEEERARGRNCGFVAFMGRKDAERSFKDLLGKDVENFEMRLSWGKPVPIPSKAIFVPPAIIESSVPPPPSGLPFNAQPSKPLLRPPSAPDELQKTLESAVVKVVIPTDRQLLCLIHRMIEFVIREGPLFEAMIMNREINSKKFRFLFDNQTPAHIYYRWKLYSVLQGESVTKWRTESFRMFKHGSTWYPPPTSQLTQGVTDEAFEKAKEEMESKRGRLTEVQREKLEDMLRNLTPERSKIGDAMIYCIDHAESSEEIIDCIAESLSILQTPINKKIARLFLISDILHNCSAKVLNATNYRKGIEVRLVDIFRDVHDAWANVESRLKAEQFKQRVMTCFRAWEDWTIYPSDFLIKLQNIFLGLVKPEPNETHRKVADDLDGVPLDDIDGVPITGNAGGGGIQEDIDGVPLLGVDDYDGLPMEDSEEKRQALARFVRSKWETLDPQEVAAQAVTTSKWELLEQQASDGAQEDEDVDGVPLVENYGSSSPSSGEELSQSRSEGDSRSEMNEEKRRKLREIEVRVVKYVDDLESGKRERKPGLSFLEQVEQYRHKLLIKGDEELSAMRRDDERGNGGGSKEKRNKRSRSQSPHSSKASSKRSPKSDRSKRSRSRSRSPKKSHKPSNSKSRSKSPAHHRHKSKKSRH